MLEPTLEGYRRLRRDGDLEDILPPLELCRVRRFDPVRYNSADDVATLIAGCASIKGWVTCQSARPALVGGSWAPTPGGGALLQADLVVDHNRSLQLRHIGGHSWLATWIEEHAMDGDDAPGSLACLAQDLTFELQVALGRKLLYRRFWRLDPDGQALAPLSRIVDVEPSEGPV